MGKLQKKNDNRKAQFNCIDITFQYKLSLQNIEYEGIHESVRVPKEMIQRVINKQHFIKEDKLQALSEVLNNTNGC